MLPIAYRAVCARAPNYATPKKCRARGALLCARARVWSTAMRQYILQVKDLVKTFEIGGGYLGGEKQIVRAVKGVSFDLIRGRSIGLVGESGCVIYTVALTILRLLEPDSGQVDRKSTRLNSSHV